jgi:sugar O-acyltransferase (sialic acid O-acetyltransferase NeuD family)
MSDIVIFGASMTAEVAKAYLEAHTDHHIVGFTVDPAYATTDTFHGLPLVPWDRLEQVFPPSQVQLLGPISYRRLNEFRRDRYLEGKGRGYRFASFIHPDCHIYTGDIGEHCFILEGNVIEPYAKIGNNVILWGGNYIAHHCVIGDHCFFSSQIGIAGATRIGERCFLGGKVGITEGLTIGDGCLLSAAVIVTKDVPPGSVVVRASRDRIALFPSSRARGLL